MSFTNNNPSTGFTHLVDVIQRPRWLQSWEKQRHGAFHPIIEGIGEFMGVFFYVYCGVGATAAFNIGTLAELPGIGSLLTVGFAYAIGIVTAISIASSASGGHFNPCISIAQAVWHGFPWKKVPYFIACQILGAYFACLLVYGQYRTTLKTIEELLIVTGKYDAVQFTPNGIAGIFALYTQEGANLRDAFMNEFFVDFFLALVIWGCMDPTNFFVPPAVGPFIIGLAYATVIWDFAPGALAANTARDVGARLMAITIWGTKANGGAYAAIAALTNIPATLLATLVYELVFTDSSRVLPRAQQEFLNGHKAHLDHKSLEEHLKASTVARSSHGSTEKAEFQNAEHV
ncbi:aquaporin-like protein [Hysterangium stoloniferum]|nr:aquaporin-like protein [Hysterangium stoloniferum]